MNRIIVVTALILVLISACNRSPKTTQVSEQPEALTESETTVTEPREGRFGLRARVRYQDIEAIAAEQIPEAHAVSDTRRLCKRIIGINACGTARWDIVLHRNENLKISGQRGQILLSAPLGFAGTVGVEGKVAKALGLSSLDVYGALHTNISVGLTMLKNWCPRISAKVDYQWLEKPTVAWRGKLDFNLEKIVNDALDKQLATLETRLNEAIDCTAFRRELANHWRSYTFALTLPALSEDEAAQQVHLNVVPTGFAFSGLRTERSDLGVSFTLDARTVVASNPISVTAIALPPLKQVDFKNSRTDFDILIRADYEQIQRVLEPRIVGIQYTSNSPAGEVRVEVTSIALSGNTAGVTVALGFNARLPGHRRDTKGVVYLNASPQMDAENETLYLRDIKLSKVIDSTLWNIVSSVFEGQIIAALERNAVFNLSTRARELEGKLAEQLRDPKRTGGVRVQVEGLSIRLLDIIPELKALAARARVSAELDIAIPLNVIRKPLQ